MHRLDCSVQAAHVDPRGRLTLPWLCAAFQEAAWQDAEGLGFGVSWLNERGLHWVLQRLRVEAVVLPGMGSRFVVTTWPSGGDRLLARRDFVAEADGERVANATSRWAVIDARTRRVARLPEDIRARAAPGPPALPGELPALDAPAADGPFHGFEVRRADLDLVRHANHIRHIEWALEAIPDEVAECGQPRLFDIAFRREAVRGDVVLATAVADGGDPCTFRHLLRRARDGEEMSRAFSRWSLE